MPKSLEQNPTILLREVLKYSVYEDGSDETQFENVKVLTAGHQLVVDFSDGSMKKNMLRWYSLSDAVDRKKR